MAKNKIFRGDVTINRPVQEEAIATAAITPGALAVKSSGEFVVHPTAAAGAEEKLYVMDLNTLLQGDTSTQWAAGDTAVAFEPRPGERYNMLVATGQNITALDTPLTSAGDGTLRIATPATEEVLCFADEIINTSGVTLVNVKF